MIIELFDIVCPACGKVLTCLPTDGVAGCHCRHCKIDFVAKIVGRTQVYQFGRGYRRCKPCDVIPQVPQDEPLLPKAVDRYARPEPILVVPMPTIDG